MKRYISACLALLLVGCAANAETIQNESTADTTVTVVENHTYDTSNATTITGTGTTFAVEGSGITATANAITITTPGIYQFEGTFDEVNVIVNVVSKGDVQLVLNDVQMNSTTGPVITVSEASNTIISVAEGTSNTLRSCGEDSEGENVVLFSHDDLTIDGSGELNLENTENDGIKGNDTVTLNNVTINIDAKDDGIVVNDLLTINGAIIDIKAGGDGIKAGKSSGDSDGDVVVNGGTITIEAEDDGIQVTGNVQVNDGDINIVTGGGYENGTSQNQFGFGGMQNGQTGFGGWGNNGGQMQMKPNGGMGMMPNMNGGQPQMGNRPDMNQNFFGYEYGDEFDQEDDDFFNQSDDETTRAKGFSVTGNITVNGGTITVNAADDAMNASKVITINGGTLELQAGDDGIHADEEVIVKAGSVRINNSYEGIESMTITFVDGVVEVIASDDGINASNPNVSESMQADGSKLLIQGGTILVSSGGDGLDTNGDGQMTGGTVTVYGPTNSGNGAIDYNGTFTVDGGLLLAGGASGMAEAPSTNSANASIIIGTTSTNPIIKITDESGNTIATYESLKSYQNLICSSDAFVKGNTYTVYENDTVLGEVTITDTNNYLNTTNTGFGNFGGFGGRH